MSLFSKKAVICENCGKEYEVRIKKGRQICSECLERIQKKRADVLGYYQYGTEVLSKDYLEEDYDKIAEHRKFIMQKYKNPMEMSVVLLKQASENYKKMSDEEAQSILMRLYQSVAEATMGAVYTKYFFIPTIYKQLIVDCEDVFAVALSTDSSMRQGHMDVIVSIVFTNDPYIPVFPMVFKGKRGFFDLTKSKKGQQAVVEFFEERCQKLKYPVMELKEYKKQIRRDEKIEGEISMELMKKIIFDAEHKCGIFQTMDLVSEMDVETAIMLDDIGFILKSHVAKCLQMDKLLQRNYWTKQMDVFMNNLK